MDYRNLTSSTVNLTCPAMAANGSISGGMPSVSIYNGIPGDIWAYMVRAGNETVTQAMLDCCSPNVPQLADLCYMWCEVPVQIVNSTCANGAGPQSSLIMSAMRRCLEKKGAEIGAASIQGPKNGAGPTAGTLSIGAVAMWTLAISGLLLGL